jgi:hypothetical protein
LASCPDAHSNALDIVTPEEKRLVVISQVELDAALMKAQHLTLSSAKR